MVVSFPGTDGRPAGRRRSTATSPIRGFTVSTKSPQAIGLGALAMLAVGCVGSTEGELVETHEIVTESPYCKVVYETTSTSRDFTATVTITNKADAIERWDLTWTVPSTFQKVTKVWDAGAHEVDGILTATALESATGLASGASVTFGFSGTVDGQLSLPTEFALAGRSCGGDAQPEVGSLAAVACSAARTWAAGAWFPTGSVVRYTNGQYYIA
jgi:hypothetical protein